jgi:hypothetical protein
MGGVSGVRREEGLFAQRRRGAERLRAGNAFRANAIVECLRRKAVRLPVARPNILLLCASAPLREPTPSSFGAVQ